MSVVQADKRYSTLDREQVALWWRDVQESAHATLAMQSGARIYVTESFEVLSLTGVGLAFVLVRIVSTSTGSPEEFYRFVHKPAIRRLIPLAKIASIAPIVDAEISVPE